MSVPEKKKKKEEENQPPKWTQQDVDKVLAKAPDASPPEARFNVNTRTNVVDELYRNQQSLQPSMFEGGQEPPPISNIPSSASIQLRMRDSFSLMASALRSVGRESMRGIALRKSQAVLLDKVWKVNMDHVETHMKILDNSAIYGIAKRKTWDSICPDSLDALLRRGPDLYRPTQWFSEHVINKDWIPMLRDFKWSIMAVGYAAVSYSVSPDTQDILVPIVLDPREYEFLWTVDQHGRRYPQIRPLGLPISPLNRNATGVSGTEAEKSDASGRSLSSMITTTTIAASTTTPGAGSEGIRNSYFAMAGPRFEYAEVFVDSWPTTDGEFHSSSRECLHELLMIDQINVDILLQNNARANVPLVVQHLNPDSFVSRLGFGTGDGRVPAMSVPPTAPYAAAALRPTMAPIGGHDMITRDSAEAALGIQLFDYGARTSAVENVTRTNAKGAVDNAIATMKLPPLTLFDRQSGEVLRGMGPHAWVNAHIYLPTGCSLGTLQLPDIQKTIIIHRDSLMSVVCNSLGLPPELLIGSGGNSARVSTSVMEQERMRAAVRYWRSRMQNYAEELYWRVFGEVTLAPLFMLAAYSGRVITSDVAEDTVKDTTIKFRFRGEQLLPAEAVEYYERGIIVRGQMEQIFMNTYGLPAEAFQNGPQETQEILAEERTGLPQKKRRKKEEHHMGDVGESDLGSVGFSSHTREPTKTTKLDP
jgi:hypothetical protein